MGSICVCAPALQNNAVLSAAPKQYVTVSGFVFAFTCFLLPVSQRCLPFVYRKDHSEQLGNSSGVSAAAGTALANVEAAAGAQH